MENRERFLKTLNFELPDDRLPMIEWATWWDKTVERWKDEGGLPLELPIEKTGEYLGLDTLRQFWLPSRTDDCPEAGYGQGIISDMASYKEAMKYLYPVNTVQNIKDCVNSLKSLHEGGKVVIWITLEGFFWFPRTLFGIENHLFAFFDEPELMHRINSDLADYHIYLIDEFCKILKPDFMTFAEDMSYNHGPMLSHGLFKEFLLPYYRRVIPILNSYGILPMVDTDGQLEPMIPWLVEAGIEGALPLERQAGVDLSRIRRSYPDFRIIGAYDKMVMNQGEQAMRAEFERLLPVMETGGFIPSCDHQTPPGVSYENYMIYLRLMKEYCTKAVKKPR